MQIGMIGLGRMGAGMVGRLLRGGYDCVVHDTQPQEMAALVGQGARGSASLQDLVGLLDAPRTLWMRVPAAAVDGLLSQLTPLLARGDCVVDGGDSHYRDDLRRAAELRAAGIHHLDVGTSGGLSGPGRGYGLTVGGERETVARLGTVFATLAPGAASAVPTPGRGKLAGSADPGWLHCGPHGAGHFVKRVHSGIEHGLMAAYAEGFNVVRQAQVGQPQPCRHEVDLPEIAELWRRGSVISSWLLDLTAEVLAADPVLAGFDGPVSDSVEADLANRLLSAMRHEFGGHLEKSAVDPPS